MNFPALLWRHSPTLLAALGLAALVAYSLIAAEETPSGGLTGSIGRAAREAGPPEDQAGSDAVDPAAKPASREADADLAGKVAGDPALAAPSGEPGGIGATAAKKTDLERGVLSLADRRADEAGNAPNESSTAEPSPTEPLSPSERILTPELIATRDKIRKALDLHYKRPVTNGDHSPWGIMHVLISYGVDSEIFAGDKKVSTAGWLCWNGSCRGMSMLYNTPSGLAVREGPGYQGHPGQFLAILSQARVKSDYPIRIDGKNYTVADLIEYEKRTCREKTELTFKLIGLSHFLPPDATWKDDRGVEWSIAKLIKEELAQPIIGAACGGSHRLTGIAYSVRNRERAKMEITGQWKRAQKYLNDYHDYTFKLQNTDGSFSANWFEGRGTIGSDERKLQTTGHILEWLVYSLPADQLSDERVVKAANFLADLMNNNPTKKWEVGPRGHAIHGLNIYDRRLFQAKMGERIELARAAEKAAAEKAASKTEKKPDGSTRAGAPLAPPQPPADAVEAKSGPTTKR